MLQRRSLKRLYEELTTLDVFDRIHDYSADADPANERLYTTRQVRRQQIIDEIARLTTAHKPEPWKPPGLIGMIAVMCSVGYAMVYYSLK